MCMTLVYPYYDNGGMLDIHMETWGGYPDEVKAGLSAIIVDDASPSDPAAPHIRDVGFPVKLFRVHQNIPWNEEGAKNLAMKHAEGWVLMTDMDHVLTAEEAGAMLGQEYDPGCFYVPPRVLLSGEPRRPHPNSWVLHADLFWRAGGCDEDFSGWYGCDAFFRRQLESVGRGVQLDHPRLVMYTVDDVPDADTQEWGRKKSPRFVTRHPQFGAKRRKGAPLPTEHLRFDWERVL
jgi:hypothetical protein